MLYLCRHSCCLVDKSVYVDVHVAGIAEVPKQSYPVKSGVKPAPVLFLRLTDGSASVQMLGLKGREAASMSVHT